MSKLIERLDGKIAAAEEYGTSFNTDKLWENVAFDVLEAYPKLRAVVEAAKDTLKDLQSHNSYCPDGCEISCRILENTLAAPEEEV
jgi:hypothetical protein